MTATRAGTVVPPIVVGAGLLGRRHVEVIGRSSTARLLAVVDPAPGAGEVARTAGVPRHASPADALAGHDTAGAGVVVATADHLLLPHGLARLAAGLPVPVGKKIATPVADGLALTEP